MGRGGLLPPSEMGRNYERSEGPERNGGARAQIYVIVRLEDDQKLFQCKLIIGVLKPETNGLENGKIYGYVIIWREDRRNYPTKNTVVS